MPSLYNSWQAQESSKKEYGLKLEEKERRIGELEGEISATNQRYTEQEAAIAQEVWMCFCVY